MQEPFFYSTTRSEKLDTVRLMPDSMRYYEWTRHSADLPFCCQQGQSTLADETSEQQTHAFAVSDKASDAGKGPTTHALQA